MERRQLLKSGAGLATVVGAGLGNEGCAHQAVVETPVQSPPSLPNPRIIEQVVSSMDRRLEWIDRHELPPDLAPQLAQPMSAERSAQFENMTRLFRQSMRTLYVTGRFMDLPDEVKTHPEVQARALGAQGEMNDAVMGVTQLLESLRPQDHRAIQATLRARPELGEQLAMVMDGPAHDDGIPFRRRMSVRTTTTTLASRMQAQSPAITIDPVVRRVRRLAAQPHDGTGTARLVAAKMGEEAFWQHQDHLAKLAARWDRQLAQVTGQNPPQTAPAPATKPAPANPGVPSGGHRTLSTGGYIMGFGLGSVGVGVIFAGLNAAFSTEVFLWPALIFGVTVGPILLIIGLIIVIIGGLMVASE